MKIKTIVIILSMLIATIFFINIQTITVGGEDPQLPSQEIAIHVAVHNATLPFKEGVCDTFIRDLNNFSWQVGNRTYRFYTNETHTDDLGFKGRLNGYDVFMMSGIHNEQIYCIHPELRVIDYETGKLRPYKAKEIMDNLEQFIINGGGYIGHCGGAAWPLTLDHPITTIKEHELNAHAFLNKSNVSALLHVYTGYPIIDELFSPLNIGKFLCVPIPRVNPDPTKVATDGYIWYAGYPRPGEDASEDIMGTPVDLVIRDKNHPLLSGFYGDTLRLHWAGSQSFTITGSGISDLADYPHECFETNQSTQINAWSYKGKFHAIVEGFFHKQLIDVWDNISYAIDWDKTGRNLPVDQHDRAAIIAFNYPNEQGGRVLLCGNHPENKVWYVGHIEDQPDTAYNSIHQGLYKWYDGDNPMNKTYCISDVNIWFVRREAAWASKKVPDDYLPPIYGKSQVVNIQPRLQNSSVFVLNCTVGWNETENVGNYWNAKNLSLYYKHNDSDWTYYGSIYNFPWYFSFNVSNASGTGRYKFCSIMNVSKDGWSGGINGTNYSCEEFPPGPDADCGIGEQIMAYFSYSPATPLVNQTINFYDESLTSNSYIFMWFWNFGDGNETSYSNPNPTHSYAQDGTYNVTLTVFDDVFNSDTISKNITVLNNPPNAGFRAYPPVVKVGKTVNFTDTSNDTDGYIVNWTWDFGDDSSSYEQNTTHQYTLPGFYTVSLQVTDNDNGTDTNVKPRCVTVINFTVNGSLLFDDPVNNTWNRIQKAIDNVSTNDIVYVQNGTYSENITVNKSLFLLGEDQNRTIINGSVLMPNPHDYELPNEGEDDGIINMTGNELLLHCNNDSTVGENYASSNLVYDYSGQGNNGTTYGPSWTTSAIKGNGAFDFDGTDDTINLSSISALTGENVTISAWTQWQNDGQSDPILSQSNNPNQGYLLYVNTTDGKPRFRLDDIEAVSSVTINSSWHHIVGTHNETTLNIYIDGVLSGSTGKTGSGISTQAYIGFDTVNDYFYGTIDEVAVWNRTLSSDEIYVMYEYNYGVFMEWFTIKNSTIGIIPSNHSAVADCTIVNTTIGVLLNGSQDVRIFVCNISHSTYGVHIIDSNPDENNNLWIGECTISNTTTSILVNNASYLYILYTSTNCSTTDIIFNNSNFSTCIVFDSTPTDNKRPDIPGAYGPEYMSTSGAYYSSYVQGGPYEFSTGTNDTNRDQVLYQWDWDDGNISDWFGPYDSGKTIGASYTYSTDGTYNVTVKAEDIYGNESNWSDSFMVTVESIPPEITNVSYTPELIGTGSDITIYADVTDNGSGVKNVTVNITYPNGTDGNYTMDLTTGNTYTYMFSNTIQAGIYNFTIWANDNVSNSNSSTGHNFTVSHLVGYTEIGSLSSNTDDHIRGSNFTIYEYGVADNLTAYINGLESVPTPTYTCMIYRQNDSKLIGTTQERHIGETGWWTFSFPDPKPILMMDTKYVLTVWGDNGSSIYYDSYLGGFRGRCSSTYTYGGSPPDPVSFMFSEYKLYSIYCNYTADTTPPVITNVSNNPAIVGYGFNVTICSDVTDNISGVSMVNVNITYPNATIESFTMNHTTGDTYQYVFADTWQNEQYNYSIWATDNADNGNSSSPYSFNVSAQANVTIATIEDIYEENEYINLTDPPANYHLADRGLTWNTYTSDETGGNILEAFTGPVNYQDENGVWTPIDCTLAPLASSHPAYSYGYRAGNDRGLYSVYVKPNIMDDWPVAFAYDKSTDPTTRVIKSKLLGIGYLDPSQDWKYVFLQNIQSSQGTTTDDTVTYPGVFTGTDLTLRYGTTGLKESITMSDTTKTLLMNNPPSRYGLSNQDSYLVFITKLDYQGLSMHNLSGVLDGNCTITENGIDFKDALDQFTCSLPLGEAYEQDNETMNYPLIYRIIQYNGDSYLLAGLKVTDLSTMTFPIVVDPSLTIYSSASDGYIVGTGSPYTTVHDATTGTVYASLSTFRIGQQYNSLGASPYSIWRGFTFFNTSALGSNVVTNATLSLYKYTDSSTTDFDITIQNGQPTYPHDPLQSSDYNKNNYAGNGGTLNTVNFTNGYNNITVTNLSWINQTGISKLCLRSSRDISSTTPTGSEYVTVYASEGGSGYQPKLVILYKNQSKINNTGSTNISGYLLLQVQFWNTTLGTWVLANDTVNETTPRTINSGEQLALDTIFNDRVNTSNLSAFGGGTYRVYAAFRDPTGDVLVNDDETLMAAWYEFTLIWDVPDP